MTEAWTVAGVGMGVFLAMIGLRFSVVRSIYIELQKKCEKIRDDAYDSFEKILYARYKKDRDPEQALGLAAEYFSWERTVDQLNRMYAGNKREIVLDFVGIALSVGYLVFGYGGISASFQSLIHFAIMACLGLVSLCNFAISIVQCNGMEKRLGVGVIRHKFNFISHILD